MEQHEAATVAFISRLRNRHEQEFAWQVFNHLRGARFLRPTLQNFPTISQARGDSIRSTIALWFRGPAPQRAVLTVRDIMPKRDGRSDKHPPTPQTIAALDAAIRFHMGCDE